MVVYKPLTKNESLIYTNKYTKVGHCFVTNHPKKTLKFKGFLIIFKGKGEILPFDKLFWKMRLHQYFAVVGFPTLQHSQSVSLVLVMIFKHSLYYFGLIGKSNAEGDALVIYSRWRHPSTKT